MLNSERGAGGVVVSKEEVAAGRKGSGGAWGSTSRNAGLAGTAPKNGRIRTPAGKNRSCRSPGCRLQVGGAENGLLTIRLQSLMTPFSVAGASNLRCLVLYLVQRCDARDIFFERSCPEQRPRAALKPQEPHSSGPFTPGAPAPAARSSRVVELWSWSRGKGKLQELSL